MKTEKLYGLYRTDGRGKWKMIRTSSFLQHLNKTSWLSKKGDEWHFVWPVLPVKRSLRLPKFTSFSWHGLYRPLKPSRFERYINKEVD